MTVTSVLNPQFIKMNFQSLCPTYWNGIPTFSHFRHTFASSTRDGESTVQATKAMRNTISRDCDLWKPPNSKNDGGNKNR